MKTEVLFLIKIMNQNREYKHIERFLPQPKAQAEIPEDDEEDEVELDENGNPTVPAGSETAGEAPAEATENAMEDSENSKE